MGKITLYVKDEDIKVWRDFKRAIEARNESASQKIMSYIKQMMVEGKINPQTRLNQYENVGTKLLDPFGCGNVLAVATAGKKVRCKLSGKQVWRGFCETTCRENKNRRR